MYIFAQDLWLSNPLSSESFLTGICGRSLVQDSAFVFLNLTNATCLRTFITVVDSQVVEHPLPLACATEERMSELRSEALYRDKNLRNVFGEFILYSNRSANVKKILNVQATRICRLQADKLLLDKFWYSFLLGMQDRMADCKTMTKQQ